LLLTVAFIDQKLFCQLDVELVPDLGQMLYDLILLGELIIV